MTNSQQLLVEYVQTASETAFRELVTRYVDLVYSAAVRLVNGDTHLAQDVTQMVFVDLARTARTLSREVMLGGWLHRHTCFVARKTLRSNRRRQARERQVVEMNALEDHSAANLALVAPVLDDAINQLESEDRTAILLRFFEQNNFRSVGEALGSNEEAARKRVNRALGKLESLLKHRGVALSTTALGTALLTQVVTAAPAGLAANIAGIALAGAAAGSGTALTILKIMSMTKLKIGIISALVVAGVAVPVVMHQHAQTELREAKESLRQQTEENQHLALENEQLAQHGTPAGASVPASGGPSRELLQLRGEVGRLRLDNAETAEPVTHDAVEARYKHAQELAASGEKAAALKEFLWCFDVGMPRVAAYSGVRASFLLSSIAKLGEQYPEALAALQERRDQALQRMLASPTALDATMDFAALNRVLKEEQNTLAAFDQLPADDQRRQVLASSAYDQLVTAQRYGDALVGKSYAQVSAQFEMMSAERPLPPNIPNPEMIRKAQHDSLISSVAQNVEVFAGAGDLPHARTLAARLLAFDPSPETKALLQQHAVRAGQPDLLNAVPNP
ncbi:MAG TPA: sigma-70 family RNA polymerase sigma factor [Candidatus Binatia bacterium]|jgi:RNA polymerase sigma factor (sigma-70 family)|nr:sigma-70 family RNA polymerase sigma factor [Candidatus Binatia bacterium]